MILALLILVAVAVSLWRTSHGKRPARPAPGLSLREQDLGGLRDRFLADEIALEEYEAQVADALEDRPAEPPTQYAERIEVHIWGDPAGHSLHIHM